MFAFILSISLSLLSSSIILQYIRLPSFFLMSSIPLLLSNLSLPSIALLPLHFSPLLSLAPSIQALQALQRQPNAAQYFQQLMLQQQINNAQLQNLAAVQQVKVCACHAI